ncbi:hypothetical protein Tcan_00284 [Toxocara canis]|uniref:Uncharacterized protein n=1 Tax=Toxocara canis TaxID=6265 RepID=A0A0B2VIX9_TOXCA|nr:hypothetical protein Tcan_00284 [Toxocara canis]
MNSESYFLSQLPLKIYGCKFFSFCAHKVRLKTSVDFFFVYVCNVHHCFIQKLVRSCNILRPKVTNNTVIRVFSRSSTQLAISAFIFSVNRPAEQIPLEMLWFREGGCGGGEWLQIRCNGSRSSL